MKITVASTVTIEAPAARVWRILADEFESVAEWASTIPVSGPNHRAITVPDGATVAGRSCTIPGFGVTDERFTAFDAARRTFTYSVAAPKMPGFVRSAENSWAVRDLGNGRCEATSVATAQLSGPLGAMASPMLKAQFGRTIRPALQDLKVYAETGRVSARKARQISRGLPKAA